MGKYTFPRTITRGPLKGRTYETSGAYARALRDVQQAGPVAAPVRGDLIVRVVNVYEQMLAAGLAKRQAVTLMQTLFNA